LPSDAPLDDTDTLRYYNSMTESCTDSEQKLPPVHPGQVLLKDFMEPLALSRYRVAKDIGVPTLRISQIVRGQRAITADTALRLARYFGTSAAVWMRLQARYDLEVTETQLAERIEREVKQLPRQAIEVLGQGVDNHAPQT